MRVRTIKAGIVHVILAVLGIVMIFPFFWMISCAFRRPNELLTSPLKLLPANPTIDSFVHVLLETEVPRYFMNSVIMLRGFIRTIPKTLEEAAMIDGYTKLQVIFKIIVPVCSSGIFATHRFYLESKENVRVNAQLGGGSLRDVGCYPVNLIGWILNDYPTAVSAEKTVFQGVDHALVANLRYKNGVTANISCGFDACSVMLTEINGTKGSILVRESFIDNENPIQVFYEDGRVDLIPVENSDCYQLEVEEFSDAVLHDREPALGLKESIRNCGLIEEILEKARE